MTSGGIYSSVILTLVAKVGKSSRVICWFKRSWHSLFLTIWDMFLIGFSSRFLVETVGCQATTTSQAVLIFTLVRERSPFSRKSFPRGLVPFLNMLTKCSRKNKETFSAFILSWCSFLMQLLSLSEQYSLLCLRDFLFQWNRNQILIQAFFKP